MANNISGLKTAIQTAFTSNLDATTRQKLANRFVLAFPNEWATRVASGTTDNATNRGIFAIDKLFDYLNNIYRSGSSQELVATLPQPETIT
jgi:hypothetical protein